MPAVDSLVGAQRPMRRNLLRVLLGCRSRSHLLVALLLFSLALTVGLIVSTARLQDSAAAHEARHLAKAAIKNQLAEVRTVVADYATREDAYRNLVADFDQDWFDRTVGDEQYLAHAFSVTRSFLVGPNGRLVGEMRNSSIDGLGPTPTLSAATEAGFDTLVKEARASAGDETGAASGLVGYGGRLYFAAARIVQPRWEDGAAPASAGAKRDYVLGFMRPFTDRLLRDLADTYDLLDLKYLADQESPGDEGLELRTLGGRQVGELIWRVEYPSRTIYGLILPSLLGVTICVGVVGWHVARKLRLDQAELLRVLQRAQAAEVSKAEFLANMSHELRTPLNAIIGFSELMESESLGQHSDPRYAEYSSIICESGQNLLRLVNNLLEVSNTACVDSQLADDDILLRRLIESLVKTAEPWANQKSVRIDCRVAPNVDKFRGDERAARLIVQNLLSNAVKFSTPGGLIVVTVDQGDDGAVTIGVADSGVGIPREMMPSVMEPFRRAEDGYARRSEGAGLGLTVASTLVALHGGSLQIESEVGRGTAVWVHMPQMDAFVALAA